MESLLLNFLPVELVSKVLYENKGVEHPIAKELKPMFEEIQNFNQPYTYLNAIRDIQRMREFVEELCDDNDETLEDMREQTSNDYELVYYPEGISLDAWRNHRSDTMYIDVDDFDEMMKELEFDSWEQVERLNEARDKHTYELFYIGYYTDDIYDAQKIKVRILDEDEE